MLAVYLVPQLTDTSEKHMVKRPTGAKMTTREQEASLAILSIRIGKFLDWGVGPAVLGKIAVDNYG